MHRSSYQLVQGLYGMGYGGMLGTGLGDGQPYCTPLVQSDFMFTAFGEELGLTGLMAILLIYGLIVQRGLRAAVAVRDPFSKLLAGGLSFVLALQVFVIVGGVTRLIPLTGITTPFLSQGGSSLVASWMLIALLMRISDTARRPAPQPIQDEGMTQVVTAADEPRPAPDLAGGPRDVRAAPASTSTTCRASTPPAWRASRATPASSTRPEPVPARRHRHLGRQGHRGLQAEQRQRLHKYQRYYPRARSTPR